MEKEKFEGPVILITACNRDISAELAQDTKTALHQIMDQIIDIGYQEAVDVAKALEESGFEKTSIALRSEDGPEDVVEFDGFIEIDGCVGIDLNLGSAWCNGRHGLDCGWRILEPGELGLQAERLGRISTETGETTPQERLAEGAGGYPSGYMAIPDIKWDTDGVSVDDLPETAVLDAGDPEDCDIAGLLSDLFGWCVESHDKPVDAFEYWQEEAMDERLYQIPPETRPLESEKWLVKAKSCYARKEEA